MRALQRCDEAVDLVEKRMLAELDGVDATSLKDALVRCGRALD